MTILLIALKALFKLDKKIFRVIGLVITLALLLWSLFTILVSAAIMKLD